MAKVPLTELPIQIFRAIDGSNTHLAFVDAGAVHFTFKAPTAIEAKRKAKTFLADQTEKVKLNRNKARSE